MTTTIACTQPGCTGTHRGRVLRRLRLPRGRPPTATAAGPATGACTQPGCTGTFVDGYCDVCGSPAPDGTTARPPSPAPRP